MNGTLTVNRIFAARTARGDWIEAGETGHYETDYTPGQALSPAELAEGATTIATELADLGTITRVRTIEIWHLDHRYTARVTYEFDLLTGEVTAGEVEHKDRPRQRGAGAWS